MQSISDLIFDPVTIESCAGKTAFIVGNGRGKTFYPVDLLPGPIFACNLAYRHHRVDYLAFRDDLFDYDNPDFHGHNPTAVCLREFRGIKFTLGRKWSDEVGLAIKQSVRFDGDDRLYVWKWIQRGWEHQTLRFWPLGPWPDGDKIVQSSTGCVQAQIAYLMGFRRLVLVGMDLCLLPGEISSNTFVPDERENLHVDGRCRAVIGKMVEFKAQMDWFVSAVKDKVEIVKLGNFGALDIPAVEWSDLFKEG